MDAADKVSINGLVSDESTLQSKLKELPITDEELKSLRKQFFLSRETIARYKCAMLEVETKFKVLNERFSVSGEHNPIESIVTRLKTPESMIKKLYSRGLELSLESAERNLHDIAGVKVICSFVDDIYMLADCLLSQDDVTLVRAKDYIRRPKPNGYRSLHLIIEVPIYLHDEKRRMKVEVQLRTIAMESWANLEHKMRYKKDLSAELQEKISSELNECAVLAERLDAKMQTVKNEIISSSEGGWQDNLPIIYGE